MVERDLKRSLTTSNGIILCDLRSGWLKVPKYRGFDAFQKWKGAPELDGKQKARDDFFKVLELLFALPIGTLTVSLASTKPSIPIAGPVSDFFIPPAPLIQVSNLVDNAALAKSISGFIASNPNSPHAAALVSILFGHLVGSPLDNSFELLKIPECAENATLVPAPPVYAFFVDGLALSNRENFVKSLIVRATSEKRIKIVKAILDSTVEDATVLSEFDLPTMNRILRLRNNLFWTGDDPPTHRDFVPMVHQAQIVSALNPIL